MTSGADLFVVCKQCGAEVSPYITECPYCGSRLRRRAPKLPPANAPSRSPGPAGALGGLLRRTRPGPKPVRAVRRHREPGRWEHERPYATIALVALSAAMWVVFHATPNLYFHLALVGPIDGEWWKLVSTQLSYVYGLYAFITLFAIAIFGWLVERRYGPANMLVLFFGAGATGVLVASAVYAVPIADGANGAALALIAAWAAPDLRSARAGSYYEGDLLGAAALAALLLAMPFAKIFSEASWLAGVVGAAVGLLVGLSMRSAGEREL